MKRIFLLTAAVALLCACSGRMEPSGYVDPMIGTGFHGHTYPGATVPFGMVQLSPDTRTEGWDACSGYHYDDDSIIGFSHTHLSGTGCADLLDVLVSPYSSAPEITVTPDGADSMVVLVPHPFRHSDEHASCGYYAVDFTSEGILAEMTASPRTGVHRYTFCGSHPRYILIDLNHATAGETVDMGYAEVLSSKEVSGMRRTQGWVKDQYVYFNARFSEPFVNARVLSGGRQVLLTFATEVKSVVMAVGLSSVSASNALENSVTEVPSLDFDLTRGEAESLWRNALDGIVVKGGKKRDRINFYTAVYHTMLTPNTMNDVNRQYRRHDNTVSEVPEGRTYYSTLSLWDTFRAWHPLQTLADTAFVNDMIWSMLDMYDCDGELPVWPLYSGETGTMIGYHAVSVISDAYAKGIRGFDAGQALEAMMKSSDINKKGSDKYLEYGYVPSNLKRESVSLTLEYAYDDWAIANMAEKMGRTDVAEEYYSRASNYMNVFDGSTLFFRGRNTDGSWASPFEPFATGRDYTEATPWHYRFFVPHDVHGMEQMFGGRDRLVKALDDLFTVESDEMQLDLEDVTGLMGQYAHGNEPSHHMAYLYSFVGMPWKTQELTRSLLDEMYAPVPEGIIGNEDCGQMSAWYIFSALGFYPVCPGTGQFILTCPLFDEAVLTLSSGNVLKVTADNPGRNRYVSQVLLNGKPLNTPYVTYGQLMGGGELHFVLTRRPDLSLQPFSGDAPYSMTREDFVSMPYTTAQVNLFVDSVDVNLDTATPWAEIRYTLDGTEPDMASPLNSGPVRLRHSAVLKAKAFRDGAAPSRTLVLDAVKADFIRSSGVKNPESGVRYEFHEGKFSDVASMAASPVAGRGVMPAPSIASSPQEDHYGYVFSGYIDVPERGVWTFMTKSDDGSVLEINGQKVVDNDGSHAEVSATGRIALDKGLHPFRLLYFEDYEGQALSWGWMASGEEEFSDIPAERLFHK